MKKLFTRVAEKDRLYERGGVYSLSVKKKYESPEIEIINFSSDCRQEILLVSDQWDGSGNYDFGGSEWW